MKKFLRDLAGLALYVLMVLSILALLRSFVVQRFVVEGASMEQSFFDGDMLLLSKLKAHPGKPERFDVIAFKYVYDTDTYLLKRVIGLPGETVQITDGWVYIDGEKLEDPYGAEPMKTAGIAAKGITLGKDEYFVLGDNRNNSVDSRSAQIGAVKKEYIEGAVWIRMYPFDRLGKVQ